MSDDIASRMRARQEERLRTDRPTARAEMAARETRKPNGPTPSGVNITPIISHPVDHAHLAAIVAEKRIRDHRSGKHTYGNARRDCPLCVEGRP